MSCVKATSKTYCWGASRNRFVIHMFWSFVSDLWVGSHQISMYLSTPVTGRLPPPTHPYLEFGQFSNHSCDVVLSVLVIVFDVMIWGNLHGFDMLPVCVQSCHRCIVTFSLHAVDPVFVSFPAGHNEGKAVIMGCVLPNSSIPAFSYR